MLKPGKNFHLQINLLNFILSTSYILKTSKVCANISRAQRFWKNVKSQGWYLIKVNEAYRESLGAYFSFTSFICSSLFSSSSFSDLSSSASMVRLSTAIAKNTFSNTSDDYDQSREFTSNIDENELISCFNEKSWSKNAFWSLCKARFTHQILGVFLIIKKFKKCGFYRQRSN